MKCFVGYINVESKFYKNCLIDEKDLVVILVGNFMMFVICNFVIFSKINSMGVFYWIKIFGLYFGNF